MTSRADEEADRLLVLRRLSEQARGRRARPGPGRFARAERPTGPDRLSDFRRCGCVQARRRAVARPDGRLLHADRRRSVRLRPDRRRQCDERRLRDGRSSAHGARHGGFPERRRPVILATIFKGGLDKLAEAGVALLGGHTVQDAEIKFGYAVTGEVPTGRHLVERRRAAGRRAPPDQAARHRHRRRPRSSSIARLPTSIEAAIRSMTTLNRRRRRSLQALPPGAVHACTDVTGFGLIGHAIGDGGRKRVHARAFEAAMRFRCCRASGRWSRATFRAVAGRTRSTLARAPSFDRPRPGTGRSCFLRSADLRRALVRLLRREQARSSGDCPQGCRGAAPPGSGGCSPARAGARVTLCEPHAGVAEPWQFRPPNGIN